MDYVRTGKVDWTGDNPPIYLKLDPAGDWSTLALFFRINASDYGRGHMTLVLEDPYSKIGVENPTRLCYTDNAPLARYLINDFVRKFGLFRPAGEALDALPIIDGAVFSVEADYPNMLRKSPLPGTIASICGGTICRTCSRWRSPRATARPACTRCSLSSSPLDRRRSS